ncbi:hypothetical protein [Sporisorium scitamineum]|uniref:Uncharacterized protein n=1 Tax=Sporisorium scitamineum TaxID=49012 RepID=A0A0F7S9K9_9BASI|nr:hypothetical protein [Sporisorium scitamineum]
MPANNTRAKLKAGCLFESPQLAEPVSPRDKGAA